jgi:hypothetical protein
LVKEFMRLIRGVRERLYTFRKYLATPQYQPQGGI